MARKYSLEQKDELRVSLDRHFYYAQQYVDTAVKGYAREAWEYFYGNLPLPVTVGSSKWVDRTVWESVNGTLQDVLNVFCEGDQAVRFVAENDLDTEGAKIATQLVNQILLRDNPGYNVISSAAQECLVTRNSFIKFYWDECHKTRSEEVENVSPEALQGYIQGLEDGGLEDLEVEVTENDDGSVSAAVTYSETVKRVKVEYVPNEQVFVDQHATSFEDAQYFCHRVRKTKEELLEMGFPEDEIDSFNDWSDPMDSTQSTVAWSRTDWRQDIDMDIGTDFDDGACQVWVYEEYMRTSMLNKGKDKEAKLYQIIRAGNYILSIEEINCIPFVTFCPYPIPGSFYGQSVYDITKDIQDLRTALTRGIIDNVNNANYGRYTAIVGAYDRRSLLDNRPGGVVEMQRDGAVQLFPYHNLPQGIDGLLTMTEDWKEQRTGVSKLGMGINPDVFKNDNAYATVGLMMNAAQNRLRMVCRNIAHNGMMELMKGIYKLIRENGQHTMEIVTDKGVMQIDPKQLPPRNHMCVNVAISPSEKDERAQKLVGAKQLIIGDPQLGPLFGIAQDRALTAEIMDLMGIKDVHKYLMPLEELQPPQPDPMQELNLAMAQAQVEHTQAQTQKLNVDAMNERERLTFEQQKAADDSNQKAMELQFKQEHAADQMSLSNRAEDNKNALEQAKHNLEMMQQQVRQYEATLKNLEIQLGSQIEMKKQAHAENQHLHNVTKDIADMSLRQRAQEHTETMAQETLKATKIHSNKPSKSAGSK